MIFILDFGLEPSAPVFILLVKLFQLWPQGPISVGSCVPLTYPPIIAGVFVCFGAVASFLAPQDSPGPSWKLAQS